VLDFWLRLGLAGLVTLGALLGALGWALVKIRNAPARAGSIAIGAAAALTGGVVHGLVDNSFFLPDLAALTWLCVALIEHHLGSQPGTRRAAAPGDTHGDPDRVAA
jgi:O-antigen ligase